MRHMGMWVGLLSAALLGGSPAVRAGDEGLVAGRAVERRLVPGEVHRWTVAAVAGEPWRLHARQLGIDLAIEVSGPAGQSLGVVDGPIDRRGDETVLVEPVSSGVYRVEVRATTPRAMAGRYQLRLEPVVDAAPARLAAERAMTTAARQASGDRESRRQAIESYRLALDGWRTLGDRRGGARAVHAMALLLKGLRESRGEDSGALFREAAELWSKLREPGLHALALAELAIAELDRGAGDKARALLQQALALNREAGQAFEAAGNRMDLGYVAQRRGTLREAEESYRVALELYRQLGDSTWEAVLLGNLGGVFWQLGEADLALDHYQQSLAMRRAAGDRKQEAGMLNNLAALHRSLGAFESALKLYDQAARIYSKLGDSRGQALVLNNIGFVYRQLGEFERARGYYLRALKLRHELGDRRGAASTLSNLGGLHDRQDQPVEALGYFRRSLDLKRQLDDRRGQAGMASLIGGTLARLGRKQEAMAHFTLARQLLADQDYLSGEALMLSRQAEAWLELGDASRAAASARQAVELYRNLEDPVARMQALVFLARAQRARQQIDEALVALKEALAIVEDLRVGLANPSFRDTLAHSRSKLWELHVDLLVAMHVRDPWGGFERSALQAAEQARARGLLDLLAEAGAELRRGFDSELVERHQQLLQRLSLLVERRAGNGGMDRVAAIEEVRADLDLTEAEMRRRHPDFAALSHPDLPSAATLQHVLSARDLLLYFALGEERSFLWSLSVEAIDVFELPPRRQLENLARHAHRELAIRRLGGSGAEPFTAELAETVLGPITDRLGGSAERLLVVADGALHWVPFAALPMPTGGRRTGKRLLAFHEVTHLPSISVLATLGEPPVRRSPEQRSVAVVADPVFDRCDPRVVPETDGCRNTPETAYGAPRYVRLPGSRREAEAIAALAGADVLLALDFEASRESVAGDRLEPFRFVHFATHGVVDSQDPRLSGLVLSGTNAQGKTRDGILRLDDIYNLRLGADLVVLSGCRTATGRELRGEGLVGMVRGFLYAGARQVLASLWQVDDGATVELMRAFYQALFDRGLSPAAALRSAQLTLARQPRTRDPYYWAGFVVLGGRSVAPVQPPENPPRNVSAARKLGSK